MGALAILVVAAALALAACSGGPTPRTSPAGDQHRPGEPALARDRQRHHRREDPDHAVGERPDRADGRVGRLQARPRRSQPGRPDH